MLHLISVSLPPLAFLLQSYSKASNLQYNWNKVKSSDIKHGEMGKKHKKHKPEWRTVDGTRMHIQIIVTAFVLASFSLASLASSSDIRFALFLL